MIQTIIDQKYHFLSMFNPKSGAYVRTGIIDEQGRDTGVDPFMASFPHLIDVGIMGIVDMVKPAYASKLG